MKAQKARVLIVEDSHVVREFLQEIIRRDPRLEVAAAVDSAEEALRCLDHLAPDVISMDIRLPGMNGFEATQRIMSERPTPIVVVSASVEAEDLRISMRALEAGALTVVEKPVGTSHEDYAMLAERLCTQLAIMSQVRVVRQRLPRGWRPAPGRRPGSPRPQEGGRAGRLGPFSLVGVVTSTGGPNALIQLLGGLGSDFPLPILLVQHITTSFFMGFVSWLDSVCPFSVVVAKDGEVTVPGRIYMSPPDHHLLVDHGCLRLGTGEPVCAQRPSGTVLFQSMARSLGAQAVGLLLTGMGEDGAQGLLEMRKAGGYTIAEDESTAIVYGMPATAARLGAAMESLPLPAIAPRVRALTAVQAEVS